MLDKLLSNYHWAWSDEALDVFRALPTFRDDPFEAVRTLSATDCARLEKEHLGDRAQQAVDALERYLASAPTVRKVAYFSAEFGIHECLPIYSGGLGVLAGDHLKSASDLALPLIGMGIVYRGGYFHQKIDAQGMQSEEYPPLHPLESGFQLATDPSGRPVRVVVPLDGQQLQVRVWRIDVGRVPLYLLDTDLDENSQTDRWITSHLYGGDRETRLRQEIVLGIGGLRALRALGYDAIDTFHLNEGHAAFLCLEAIKEGRLPDEPLSLSRARAAGRVVFTTHTPVPAGHDAFTPEMVAAFLGHYAEAELRCSMDDLLALGHGVRGVSPFSMTELAFSVCRAANAVSARHGEVTRAMFPGRPVDSVTNGVHHLTWTAASNRRLYDTYLPGWRDAPERLADSQALPDAELQAAHQVNKDALVVRLNAIQDIQLDPACLTLGFARRFATYKRAALLFQDPARLAAAAERGLQLIVSGKAHPQDEAGKGLIKDVIRLGRESRLRVVFVPDYDLGLGKLLTAGVDVWLNNPRRPMEASGTSGMKAALNGVPNLSVLDGWWVEGYDGTNGWAIGPDYQPSSAADEDVRDAESLYTLLAERVIPEYYDSPNTWLLRMKRAIGSGSWFTTQRMVEEYARRMYRLPPPPAHPTA